MVTQKKSLKVCRCRTLQNFFKHTSKERITEYMNTLRADKQTEIIPGEDSNNIEREMELVYHAISVEDINFAILYDAIEKILEKIRFKRSH